MRKERTRRIARYIKDMGELWLIRHGETDWSRSGQHTSVTDLPLTAEGERKAVAVGRLLAGKHFDVVLCSPMKRSADTCRLAGYAGAMRTAGDLKEWYYGGYEGLTSAQIHESNPKWTIWTGTPPGGETADQVAARADRVIAETAGAGDAALFSHGHLLRVLAARWLGLDATAGRFFALSTGSVSVLGFERETRVISRWNQVP